MIWLTYVMKQRPQKVQWTSIISYGCNIKKEREFLRNELLGVALLNTFMYNIQPCSLYSSCCALKPLSLESRYTELTFPVSVQTESDSPRCCLFGFEAAEGSACLGWCRVHRSPWKKQTSTDGFTWTRLTGGHSQGNSQPAGLEKSHCQVCFSWPGGLSVSPYKSQAEKPNWRSWCVSYTSHVGPALWWPGYSPSEYTHFPGHGKHCG